MDDLAERLDLIIALIEGARAMPLTASCVLNRAEMLDALEDLRARLPERLADADRVLADSEAIIDDAHRRAAAIVADGRRENARLASGSAVVAQAESDAAAIMAAARQAAEEMRIQIDSYVDGKLAGFEDLLDRTLTSVTRGRERLASRGAVATAAGQVAAAGGHEPGMDQAHMGHAYGMGPGDATGPHGVAGPEDAPGGHGDLYPADGADLGAGAGSRSEFPHAGYGARDGGRHSGGDRWAGVSVTRGGMAGHVRLTSGVGAPIG